MSESKILHSFVQQLKKFRKLYYAPDKWIDLSEYILILCDKDNSGNITCTELQHLTIALGMRLTDSELTNDNRCTNELLVNARQKLDRIYGENDNSYDAMKQKLDAIYEEIDNSHGAIKQIFRCKPATIL